MVRNGPVITTVPPAGRGCSARQRNMRADQAGRLSSGPCPGRWASVRTAVSAWCGWRYIAQAVTVIWGMSSLMAPRPRGCVTAPMVWPFISSRTKREPERKKGSGPVSHGRDHSLLLQRTFRGVSPVRRGNGGRVPARFPGHVPCHGLRSSPPALPSARKERRRGGDGRPR